jgi:hypothetical protein
LPITVLPVAVVNEVVIVIYIYIVITTPTAVAAPAATKGSAHSDANSERKRHSGCVIAGWGIVNGRIGIGRGAVNHYRVVAGNVDNLWVRLFDDDHLLVFHYLRFDLHLLGGFQISLFLSLRAHALHSIHHVGLLGQNSISEVCRPLDVVR